MHKIGGSLHLMASGLAVFSYTLYLIIESIGTSMRTINYAILTTSFTFNVNELSTNGVDVRLLW